MCMKVLGAVWRMDEMLEFGMWMDIYPFSVLERTSFGY